MATSFDPFGAQPLRATLATASMPRRVHRVLEQVFSLASGELAHSLDQLLVDFEQELFRLAEQATSDPAESKQYIEILRCLRLHRADMVPQFLVELEAALAVLREPALPQLQALAQSGMHNLRLVEDSEIDEEAALRMIAVRHEWRASLPLLLLGQRFGVLAGAPAFDAERLPLGPHRLANMLAKASRALEVGIEARLLLFRLFDRQLTSGYIPLIEAVNLLLVHQNVLPGLSYVPLRVRGPARDATGTAAQITAPTTGTDGTRVYTGRPGDADTSAGSEDGEMFEMLQEMLTERRGLLDKLRAPGKLPHRTSLETPEVELALATMQSTPATQRSLRSLSDIRQSLLAQRRQQTGEAAALSSSDSDTFELLGILYSAIGREMRSDAPGIGLIERLQLPLLRLALRDRGFFIQRQHSARQFLNTVAESGARWLTEDEADPQLLAQLRTAVDHVVEHGDGGIAVFEDVNRTLAQHLQAMARRAEVSERRHVEAARGKEKLELAKRHALQTIEAIVSDHRPPQFLRSLLCQAWVDVLTLVLLRHGEESTEWRAHLEATRQIIAINMHGADAPAGLAERIEEGLTLVGYHGDEAVAIARRLTSDEDTESDVADGDHASRTELTMKIKASTRLGVDALPEAAERAPRNAREQARHEQLAALPFGSLIEVTLDSGELSRRRLAWFSTATDRALLVNQRGQVVEETTLDKLARLFAAEKLDIVTVDRARLVDRAWQAAVSSLRNLSSRESPTGDSA